MVTQDFIKNVSEADFEFEVIAFSLQAPVLVDFWAEWCGPCRVLGPILERLAQEGQGAFRLAKVNIDENPNLAVRYGIHGIPAVKAFRDGQMIAGFAGVQPEARLREFIRSIAPTKGDLAIEKGLFLLNSHQTKEAESAFREALQFSPQEPAALLGLSKCLILLGKIDESVQILSDFPTSKEYTSAQNLLALSKALAEEKQAQPPSNGNPLDPAYARALQLILRTNIEAAMDGLLDILREDKNYREGAARKIMIALFELLGNDHPITRAYRNEMASILF